MELEKLIDKAEMRNIKYSVFREPDIGNEITAIALEPNLVSKKLTSHIKLLG
jgi:hypothetical protein